MARIRMPGGCRKSGTSFGRLQSRFAVIVLLVGAGFPSVLMADHDELASFGYRELGSDSIPLLTILLDLKDSEHNQV